MSFDLSSITKSIGSFVPSSDAMVQNVVQSAAVGVVIAGLKAQLGNGALDPLGILPKAAVTPASANHPDVTAGATITASAFSALPAASQAMLAASGVHIVAG